MSPWQFGHFTMCVVGILGFASERLLGVGLDNCLVVGARRAT